MYDVVGLKGLETQGWELVERYHSAEDIRSEYERLKRERERELLNQRTNPGGSLSVTINAIDFMSFWANIDDEDDDQEKLTWRDLPSMFEMQDIGMTQTVEAPLTVKDRLMMGGSLETKNGIGSGGISLAWRRLISDTLWVELELSGGNGAAVSCKVFRTFSRFMYGYVQMLGRVSSNTGLEPGISAGITRQLDRNLQGTISLKFGLQNSCTCSLQYDDSRHNRNLLGALVLSIPASFVLLSYRHRFQGDHDGLGKISLKFGQILPILDVSYDRKITKFTTIGVVWRLTYLRGVTIRLRIQRGQQNYQLSLILCDTEEYFPSSVVWGVAVPALFYQLVKFAVKPWLENKRLRTALKEHKEATWSSNARRVEAEALIRLTRESAERIRSEEVQKQGLVIVEAWYGKLYNTAETEYAAFNQQRIIDVSIPLQALVKDSKLIIYDQSKANLPGFYDPCPGETKSLRIVYRFHNRKHQVTIADNKKLELPKEAHRCGEDDDEALES